ncbi:hypothetical protein ACS0TY_027788 [Phlomoides rotata]
MSLIHLFWAILVVLDVGSVRICLDLYGTNLSTENEQNNEASHMENEIYDLTTMVEDLDAMVEAEINEECTEINNEGFEEFGMLCYHSLRVLLINSIQKIPDAYIKYRWTKTAKSEVWDKFGRVLSITPQAGRSIPWRHNITRKFYNLVLRSEDNEDAIKIIEESLNRDSLAIDSLCCIESVRMLSSGKSSSQILDPARSRTKGRGKRAKGHFEMSKKKRGGTSTSVQANEFGSKTLKPHLF